MGEVATGKGRDSRAEEDGHRKGGKAERTQGRERSPAIMTEDATRDKGKNGEQEEAFMAEGVHHGAMRN